MRQTLSNVSLTVNPNLTTEECSVPYSSASKTEHTFTQNPGVSFPLKQRREKPSIYRKLFASPCHVQDDQSVNEERMLNRGNTYTTSSSLTYANATKNFPDEYRDRLPVGTSLFNSPSRKENAMERRRFPLEANVDFSSSVNSRNPNLNIVQDENGIENTARNVLKGTPVDEKSSGTSSLVHSTVNKKEAIEYSSLLATASASLNSKLRKKAESAFKRIQSSSINPSSTNCSTLINERKILVPTPIKPVIGNNKLFCHRQIVHEAFVKSRNNAQEVLLDAEVSLYTRNIDYLRKDESEPRLINPLAKVFSEGDERVSEP